MVKEWLARWPLRTKLVALTTLLLTVALALTGIVTSSILTSYLRNQIDDQLIRSASSPAQLQAIIDGTESGGRDNRPSDFYVLFRDASGGRDEWYESIWQPTRDRYGIPDIPVGTGLETAEQPYRGNRGRTSEIFEPFTVSATDAPSPTQWRVVATQVASGRPGPGAAGSRIMAAYLALPLTSIQQASNMLARTLVWSGLAIVGLGGAIAFWLVRRSLAPLHQIDQTAASIVADNDITRRIPETSPPSTEVGSLQVSLNAMLSQIEQSFNAQAATNQRMRRFVSDASHELRTPLAVMKGYSELYRMGGIPVDAVAGTFTRIEDSATQMGGLVEELLTLARLDEGRDIRQEPVNLTALVEAAAQDLTALDPTRPIIKPAQLSEPVLVRGDAERLQQVLANLIGNVIRHTPAGSPVELTLMPDGGYAVLQVIDHGLGISPDEEQKIFERFYRADASRNRESGGSGLGLAIVAGIVAAHGGAVTAAQTKGGGLTITLRLPLRD